MRNILYILFALTFCACGKRHDITPQFVCYFYHDTVFLPETDSFPEFSSQFYRDIECPLPTNEAWMNIHDYILSNVLYDSITAEWQTLYEYPATVAKDTESTYSHKYNDYISLRTCLLKDSIYGYYCHKKKYYNGAHGIEGYWYRYFDTRTGKPISIDDLASDISSISEYLDYHIRHSDKSWGILVDTIKANDNFFISDSGLTFIYNQYEIACIMADTIMCFVPYNIIHPYAQ